MRARSLALPGKREGGRMLLVQAGVDNHLERALAGNVERVDDQVLVEGLEKLAELLAVLLDIELDLVASRPREVEGDLMRVGGADLLGEVLEVNLGRAVCSRLDDVVRHPARVEVFVLLGGGDDEHRGVQIRDIHFLRVPSTLSQVCLGVRHCLL